MKKMLKFAIVVASLLVASVAWAGPQTVTLVVSNMTCETCPITVKKALTNVNGVTQAKVDFDKKEAVVTFDDAKTDVAALIKATTNAGPDCTTM